MQASRDAASSNRLRFLLKAWKRSGLRFAPVWWVGAGFVLLLTLQGVLLNHGLTQLHSIGRVMEEMVTEALPAERLARDMQGAAHQRITLLLRMLAEPDPFARDDDAQAFTAAGLEFGRARDALLALPLSPAWRAEFDALLRQAVSLSEIQRSMVQALLEGRDDDARALLQQHHVLARQRDLVAGLQRLAEERRMHAAQLQREAKERQLQAQQVVLILGGSLFVLGVMIGAAVTFMLARADRLLRLEMERQRVAAHTDPLTGLLNRRGFEAERARWCEEPQDKIHSLLLIDLDHFKPINDQAGHDAGDAALRRVAMLLRDHVRPQDLLARLGGDEFAVLLRELPKAGACEVAQRLVQALQNFTFEWNGQRFELGASIGVAEFSSQAAARDWGAVLKAADTACYAAKAGGRNRHATAEAAGSAGMR